MWKKEVKSTFVLLFAIFAIRSAIAEPYVVPTGSMIPAIVPGDRLLVNKMAYDLKFPFTSISLFSVQKPERGDVVVFKYPKDPNINFVKRLIGLPNDLISVKDGVVSINNKPIAISSDEVQNVQTAILNGQNYVEIIGEKRVSIRRTAHTPNNSSIDYRVPDGFYFFMGIQSSK